MAPNDDIFAADGYGRNTKAAIMTSSRDGNIYGAEVGQWGV
jgi:hypothetical protein